MKITVTLAGTLTSYAGRCFDESLVHSQGRQSQKREIQKVLLAGPEYLDIKIQLIYVTIWQTELLSSVEAADGDNNSDSDLSQALLDNLLCVGQ